MPDSNYLTICFTGRRPKDLAGYEKDKYGAFVADLESKLKTICQDSDKPVKFISGGAQGFDQLAFWSVDLLKRHNSNMNIKNVVYVPFKGQESIWPKETLFGRDDFNKMLSRADEVVYLKDEIPGMGEKPTPPSAKRAINGALLSRNHHMVDDSDYVIALYPGDDWQTNSGGTSECMRYAKDAHKKVMQLKYVFNEDGSLAIGSVNTIDNSVEAVQDEAQPIPDDAFERG